MRCDEARRRLSLAMDDGLPLAERDELDDHVSDCATCAAYAQYLAAVRTALRFEVVADGPDLAPRVLATVAAGDAPTGPSPASRRLVPLVAAAVAGALVGAVLVSGTRPGSAPRAVAAAVPEQVLRAQARLHSLRASVRVVERGWHPDVPVRTYTGTLAYRSPEAFALRLVDRTHYPSRRWRPNNATVVVHDTDAWTSGPAACPIEGLPTCTPAAARMRALLNREPFAADGPAPLDLVLPARSFSIGRTARVLPGSHRVAGRSALVVLTTAAQVAPLVGVLGDAGNFRAVHPTDAVELWLDRSALVPLRLVVTAAPGADRRRWAEERGYRDAPGDTVLELRLSSVEINGTVAAASFPPPPADAAVRDAGFVVENDASAPLVPSWLPAGMRPYRAGSVAGPLETRVWSATDGRAWVKVRSVAGWTGGRLFGDVGDIVRELPVGSGTGYVSEDGSTVALHDEHASVDMVVTGSVPLDQLLRVAASTGVHGVPVPPGWAEASSATVAEASSALPGLLVPARSSAYAAPAVQVDDGPVVTISVAGPGQRGYQLVESSGTALSPPMDADVHAVAVRGATGRWSPSLGVLEWVDDNARVVELRSSTLSLSELVQVAAGLRPAAP